MPLSELHAKRSPRTPDGAPSVWTEETIGILKELWAEGCSASQIAARLGVTRNAVIGKIHRLDLAARPPRARAPKPSSPRRPVVRAPHVRPAQAEPAHLSATFASEELTGEATLMTLGTKMCRWPIGDPALEAFRLCGRTAETGPYCAHHGRLAYVTPRARTASNARLLSSLRRVL